jgi:hypothetical protein
VKWLEEIHQVTMTQVTISNTLQRLAELLAWEETVNGNTKTRRSVMYQDVDEALAQRVEAYQGNINISGEMIRQKAAQFLERLHPDAPKFKFSNGWLAKFKQRHQIQSHRRFGESGVADTEIIEESLPHIRIILDQYALADIYNMDETGLFYRMQADNSLATRQLKGRKQTRSASPSLYAATLTGLTNCHSGSSANRFAPAASKTSTSTTSTTSTTPTKMRG